MGKTTAQVLVGTGGWDHEVFDECFYPEPGLESLEKLRFYSRFFDTVEIRPTFWDDTIDELDAARWVDAVASNRRFQFSVKLHSSFTHRASIDLACARTIRGLSYELGRHDCLGAILAQFPYAFTNTSAHRSHLMKLAEVFQGFPIHVELRHETWE